MCGSLTPDLPHGVSKLVVCVQIKVAPCGQRWSLWTTERHNEHAVRTAASFFLSPDHWRMGRHGHTVKTIYQSWCSIPSGFWPLARKHCFIFKADRASLMSVLEKDGFEPDSASILPEHPLFFVKFSHPLTSANPSSIEPELLSQAYQDFGHIPEGYGIPMAFDMQCRSAFVMPAWEVSRFTQVSEHHIWQPSFFKMLAFAKRVYSEKEIIHSDIRRQNIVWHTNRILNPQ